MVSNFLSRGKDLLKPPDSPVEGAQGVTTVLPKQYSDAYIYPNPQFQKKGHSLDAFRCPWAYPKFEKGRREETPSRAANAQSALGGVLISPDGRRLPLSLWPPPFQKENNHFPSLVFRVFLFLTSPIYYAFFSSLRPTINGLLDLSPQGTDPTSVSDPVPEQAGRGHFWSDGAGYGWFFYRRCC